MNRHQQYLHILRKSQYIFPDCCFLCCILCVGSSLWHRHQPHQPYQPQQLQHKPLKRTRPVESINSGVGEVAEAEAEAGEEEEQEDLGVELRDSLGEAAIAGGSRGT